MDGWVVGTGREQPGEQLGRWATETQRNHQLTIIPHNEIHHFLKVCQLSLLVRWQRM